MNITLIPPSQFHACVSLPPSKSVASRVMIIRSLMNGKFSIDRMPDCDDIKALNDAIIAVESTKTSNLNIGGAGTAMRFLTALLAAKEGEYVIDGNERMRQRPIGELVTALKSLGADITYLGNEGFPPLRISGKRLQGGRVEMRGDISSQFVSALLMIGTTMTQGLEIRLTTKISSRPYIDLTLDVMRDFGAKVTWKGIDTLAVEPTPYLYKGDSYAIEDDWTAASYWFGMQYMSTNGQKSPVFSSFLTKNRQGDSIIPQLFEQLREDGVFEFDFTDNPDLVQTMVVCCCATEKSFRFTGLKSLRIKETDRIVALQKELGKCGYNISVESDKISYDASVATLTQKPKSVAIDTYGDHRMAMAFAMLSLKIPGLTINDAEVVSKSYPTFWEDLRKSGFEVRVV
ncbi:MAG: 3-phosphoshikimate 1-carboxyvinyltransferase [Prevotellaceae bacterium]|nr:3-phosphoshikimate 1-carboxyvinyltransferase [Prevotellaceae bacterium]